MSQHTHLCVSPRQHTHTSLSLSLSQAVRGLLRSAITRLECLYDTPRVPMSLSLSGRAGAAQERWPNTGAGSRTHGPAAHRCSWLQEHHTGPAARRCSWLQEHHTFGAHGPTTPRSGGGRSRCGGCSWVKNIQHPSAPRGGGGRGRCGVASVVHEGRARRPDCWYSEGGGA